jgi:hypothetical protein
LRCAFLYVWGGGVAQEARLCLADGDCWARRF